MCEKIAVDFKGVGTPRNPQLEIFVTMLILCVLIRNNMFELSRGVLAKPLDFQPRPPFGLLAPFSVCPALSAALQGRYQFFVAVCFRAVAGLQVCKSRFVVFFGEGVCGFFGNDYIVSEAEGVG